MRPELIACIYKRMNVCMFQMTITGVVQLLLPFAIFANVVFTLVKCDRAILGTSSTKKNTVSDEGIRSGVDEKEQRRIEG